MPGLGGIAMVNRPRAGASERSQPTVFAVRVGHREAPARNVATM